ncbi:DICT sensory domain-containing protein [Nocardioides litoris]|uniref:DICT sensory domain-containing protein n=1 Tax=Nocardioides litoris TaxID=1926648 RepID=UPI0011200A7D|nr:DICT sensory domain-containing protein [Nocardioides litoris]
MVSKSGEGATLSIGDLAEATGVSAATLRVWEARHGFPVPHRLESGHRRYDDEHVAAVRDVQRRRDDGVRLDVAIEQAIAARDVPDPVEVSTPSVFARLRQTHPGLQPLRLTKGTLLGLSWAIEDEFAARAHRSHLFGAFQRTRHYRSAESRWNDLARTMGCTFVFADFPADAEHAPEPGRPIKVPVPAQHPMAREWAVVCDNPDLPVALTAWELPGQEGVRDADRLFESVWTVDQSAVREAALVCARTADALGVSGAAGVADELGRADSRGQADLAQVTSLFNRVVSYVDSRTVVHP